MQIMNKTTSACVIVGIICLVVGFFTKGIFFTPELPVATAEGEITPEQRMAQAITSINNTLGEFKWHSTVAAELTRISQKDTQIGHNLSRLNGKYGDLSDRMGDIWHEQDQLRIFMARYFSGMVVNEFAKGDPEDDTSQWRIGTGYNSLKTDKYWPWENVVMLDVQRYRSPNGGEPEEELDAEGKVIEPLPVVPDDATFLEGLTLMRIRGVRFLTPNDKNFQGWFLRLGGGNVVLVPNDIDRDAHIQIVGQEPARVSVAIIEAMQTKGIYLPKELETPKEEEETT